MLQTFLSMFQITETPLRKLAESSMFPMPFMPPVPPILPVFPMPFWGWNKDSGKRARKESTASDADESAEGNTVETADDSADNTDK